MNNTDYNLPEDLNLEMLMDNEIVKKAEKDKKRRSGRAKKSQEEAAAELAKQRPITCIYDEGVKIVEETLSVKLVPSLAPGNICNHLVYSVANPVPVPGITYPKDFKFFKLMSKKEVGKKFLSYWNEVAEKMKPDTLKFWHPMFFPSGKASVLAGFVNELIILDGEYDRQYGVENYDLGISFLPSTLKEGDVPLAFVPEKGWFDERFHEIEAKDVLCLFPEAEREILMTCIGRAACGRPNSLPVGWEEPIQHTFRTMPIIYGIDPGTGKSHITNLVRDALKSVGYQIREFNTLGDRFNLGPIMAAHVAYKDDMVSASLEATLKSDRTKTMITNGMQLVEDKGTNAYTQAAHCLVLTNVNRFDPNVTYKLDDGILDRICLLKTYFKKDLDRLVKEAKGASEGSPSFKAWIHLDYLAEKYKTTQIGLMLWVIRLCADKFWSLIQKEKGVFENKLEKDMRYWSTRLRESFKPAMDKNIIYFMQVSKAIRSANLEVFHMPELSAVSLKDCLHALHYVFIDPRAHLVRELIKADWENKERPAIHPWHGVKNLEKQSIDGAWKVCYKILQENSTAKMNRNDVIKEVFGFMSLRNGFKLGSGAVYIVQAWNDCRSVYDEDILQIASDIQKTLKEGFPEVFKTLINENTQTETEHLYKFEYDPCQNAEKLRQQSQLESL